MDEMRDEFIVLKINARVFHIASVKYLNELLENDIKCVLIMSGNVHVGLIRRIHSKETLHSICAITDNQELCD